MEAIDELTGPKDHSHIVKGKRTKRQRPQSPIPFTITANSSSGDGGGGYGSNGDIINNNNHHHHETNYSSPATSGEFMDSTTEEEEDMANCLILLAQGGHSREPSNPKEDEEAAGLTYKFTSKRYLEAPSSGNGKMGIFVYQCKTCSRTFPSFQALGGHRASHKKPKLMAAAAAAEERKRPVVLSDEEEPLSLQLSNKGFYGSATKFKVHECSICGAEFSSGQALGGHMRRHRGPSGTNTTLSLSPTSPPIVLEAEETNNKARNVLTLDLNLPAPEDDHLRDSKVALSSKQQQQQSPLVFPATPALVDCQY
ncbi:zinc finger protein ZAT5-like [Cornus florida]|uniref:zinc finger protein ZAT5-like n=1 Tax=Cornus florida TaxID=4283 RepID=UPI0028972E34|nr:zinc finger protein ZAT5-like [Cornus florida]